MLVRLVNELEEVKGFGACGITRALLQSFDLANVELEEQSESKGICWHSECLSHNYTRGEVREVKVVLDTHMADRAASHSQSLLVELAL